MLRVEATYDVPLLDVMLVGKFEELSVGRIGDIDPGKTVAFWCPVFDLQTATSMDPVDICDLSTLNSLDRMRNYRLIFRI